jgi:hypothetical protein
VRVLVDRGVNISVKGDNDLDHEVNYLNRLLQAEHVARRLWQLFVAIGSMWLSIFFIPEQM